MNDQETVYDSKAFKEIISKAENASSKLNDSIISKLTNWPSGFAYKNNANSTNAKLLMASHDIKILISNLETFKSQLDTLNGEKFELVFLDLSDEYYKKYGEELTDTLDEYFGYQDPEEMIFLAYLNSYENAAAANYLYGNAEYTDYVSKFITKDKKNFIAYNDNLGRDDLNFGFGINYYLGGKYNWTDYFKTAGVDIEDGNYRQVGKSQCSVESVLKVQSQILEEKEKLVINCIGSDNYYNLTKGQQNVLKDIAYHGCSEWSSLKNMLDAGKSKEFIANNWPRISSTQYNNQDRANARKTLWLEDKYIASNGEEITEVSK